MKRFPLYRLCHACKGLRGTGNQNGYWKNKPLSSNIFFTYIYNRTDTSNPILLLLYLWLYLFMIIIYKEHFLIFRVNQEWLWKVRSPIFAFQRTKEGSAIYIIKTVCSANSSCFSGFTSKLGLAAISLSISPEDVLLWTVQTDRLQALSFRIQRPLNTYGGLVPLLVLPVCWLLESWRRHTGRRLQGEKHAVYK